jgi:hypothetical protein
MAGIAVLLGSASITLISCSQQAIPAPGSIAPNTATAQGSTTQSGTLSPSVTLNVTLPTSGEVVTTADLPLQVIASGYRVDARYAGTADLAYVGHYHEILDGNLVDMTPLRDGNRDTVSMAGVAVGEHVLTIVPANDDHSMVMPAAVNIPFSYAGPFLPLPPPASFAGPPSISITSPANGSTVQGSSFFMSANVTNFQLCQECFGKSNIAGVGHWHIFLDQPMMAHMLTMAGGPTQEVSLVAISPGWHTFYAVLVNDQHMPFMSASTTVAAVRLFVRSGSSTQ